MIDDRVDVSLAEFTKLEWRDVVARLRPDWSIEQFEIAWADFAEMKRRRRLN